MHRTLLLTGLALLALPACTTPRAPLPSAPTEPSTSTAVAAKWIEVVLSDQVANLWEEDRLIASLPVSTGVGTSTSTTTFTGAFAVATMYPGPEETVPGVFVRDIVIFDWEHGNGFHSLPMDREGAVLDDTIGKPASAGCIRVRDSARLYDFAELGMKVVIR
jgi:lipoprotein-anchoring transpeptidase ErfK/SrfK